jgi:chromosome segregation ATPase
MRLAGALSITSLHSWSDYALNLANSAANIIGIVAAAVVLVAIAFIYFTGSELNERGSGKGMAPGQDQMKALRESRIVLAAARQSEEANASRLSEIKKELAAAKRSEDSMASRLSQAEKDLATAPRVTEEKALRLSQVEAELAITRHSADEAKAMAQQLEQSRALEG